MTNRRDVSGQIWDTDQVFAEKMFMNREQCFEQCFLIKLSSSCPVTLFFRISIHLSVVIVSLNQSVFCGCDFVEIRAILSAWARFTTVGPSQSITPSFIAV